MNESCGARRHAGAWVPSLRKTRTRSLAMLTAAALLFASNVPSASAFDKEAAYAELAAIGAQIELPQGQRGLGLPARAVP